MRRFIDDLNRTLRNDETKVSDELLACVIDACGPRSIALLQAAVLAKTQESYQLRKQVANIFSALLRLNEDDCVELVFNVADLRTALWTEADSDKGSASTGTATPPVQKCEIDITQHFLQVNCPPDLYQRLAFDKFFRDRLSSYSNAISLPSRDENHFRLLELCMDVLSTQYADAHGRMQMEPLRVYAAKRWVEHLFTFDVQLVVRSVLHRIGSKVANLLYDPVSIHHWWSPDMLWYMTTEWLTTNENVNNMI